MKPTVKPTVGDKVSVSHPDMPGKVHPDYPGVWVVKSTSGPVNAVLTQEGRTRGLRVPYTMLMAPTTEAAPPRAAVPTVYFAQGELVRVTSGRWAGLYVVLSDKGGKTITLTKLGGWDGQRLSSSRRGLVKVDPADVLKEGVQ